MRIFRLKEATKDEDSYVDGGYEGAKLWLKELNYDNLYRDMSGISV